MTYDDFAKLDIRVGAIVAAERVPHTNKLLKLSVDLGEDTLRQLVAGIAAVIDDPCVLVGRQVPVLVNLEPRTIRGIESQGMILAADDGGVPVLIHPEHTVPPGSVIG